MDTSSDPALIDHVTGSLALTEPRAVKSSFMELTMLEVITGTVESTTFIIYSWETTREPSEAFNITLFLSSPEPTSVRLGVPDTTLLFIDNQDGLCAKLTVTTSSASGSKVVTLYV